MNLSKYTDYSFRILIYLAINKDNLCTVEDISKKLKISKNHTKKIVFNLAKEGYILSLKGRTGGIKLAKKYEEVNLKEVLLFCEKFSKVVECQENKEDCTYNCKRCLVKEIIEKATESFVAEFEKYTLKDIIDRYLNDKY